MAQHHPETLFQSHRDTHTYRSRKPSPVVLYQATKKNSKSCGGGGKFILESVHFSILILDDKFSVIVKPSDSATFKDISHIYKSCQEYSDNNFQQLYLFKKFIISRRDNFPLDVSEHG